MVSPSFWGALVGGVVGALAIMAILLATSCVTERRDAQRDAEWRSRSLGRISSSISERHLEQYILNHFDTLLRDWEVFDEPPESTIDPDQECQPAGVRYRTTAGEIDLLCIDPRGDLVVIELKVTRPSDGVVAQIDRYIAWVEQNLAEPDQRVRGLIIAKALSSRLSHALARRKGIRVWTYSWQMEFKK
jgi:restriction system protein